MPLHRGIMILFNLLKHVCQNIIPLNTLPYVQSSSSSFSSLSSIIFRFFKYLRNHFIAQPRCFGYSRRKICLNLFESFPIALKVPKANRITPSLCSKNISKTTIQLGSREERRYWAKRACTTDSSRKGELDIIHPKCIIFHRCFDTFF